MEAIVVLILLGGGILGLEAIADREMGRCVSDVEASGRRELPPPDER